MELKYNIIEELEKLQKRVKYLEENPIIEKGPKGDQGIQGISGINGNDFVILGTIFSDNPNDLPADGKDGDAYFLGVNAPRDIYAYDIITSTWINQGALIGPQGEQGPQGESGIANWHVSKIILSYFSTALDWTLYEIVFYLFAKNNIPEFSTVADIGLYMETSYGNTNKPTLIATGYYRPAANEYRTVYGVNGGDIPIGYRVSIFCVGGDGIYITDDPQPDITQTLVI